MRLFPLSLDAAILTALETVTDVTAGELYQASMAVRDRAILPPLRTVTSRRFIEALWRLEQAGKIAVRRDGAGRYRLAGETVEVAR